MAIAISGLAGVSALLADGHAQAIPPHLEKLKQQIDQRNQLEAEIQHQKASPGAARSINQARDAAAQGRWDDALGHLQSVQTVEVLTASDEYLINEVLGYVLQRRGDAAGAAAAYERAFATGLVPPERQAVRQKNILQLYFEARDYPKASEYGRRLSGGAGQPDQETLVLVARAHYLVGQHRECIQTLDRVIEDARISGRPAQETWYQMQLGSYSELKDDAGATATLESLALQFPKKQYWTEFFRVFKRQHGLDPGVRHNLYRLMYDTGFMQNGIDVVKSVEESMRIRLPGEALSVLQRGKELNLFTGENNLQVERELNAEAQKAVAQDRKALGELETAARAGSSGEVDVQLGYSLLSYGQYEKAAEAIQRGQKKGGVRNPVEADLMLGRACLKLDRKTEAEAAFKRVASGGMPGDTVKTQLAMLANLWLVYLRDPSAVGRGAHGF